MKKLNLYFDLDGVIFQYEKTAYQGDDPIFDKLGQHYFRHVPPDPLMKAVVNQLLRFKDTNRIDNIYFISSISPQHEIYLEMYRDKLESLKEEFDEKYAFEHFIACYKNKANIVKAIHNKEHLNINDILIDDYNENLKQWRDAGGTAIKYINGINSEESWNGYIIKPNKELTLEKQASHILDFLYLFQDNLNPAVIRKTD